MISHIFFDRGGVILQGDSQTILSPLAKKFFLPVEKIKNTMQKTFVDFSDGKISSDDFYQAANNFFGKAFASDLMKSWDMLHAKGNVFPGMLELVEKLKTQGYFVACLTDTNDIHYRQNLSKGYDTFDDIIASNKIGFSKADDVKHGTSKFFEYALKKYGISGENALFVDDRIENCKVAEQLGIATIVFHSPGQIKKDILEIIS